jgi:hypothetical protein
LGDSSFIGGFQVEIVYANKSTERRGGGCCSKSSTDLARLSLYWRLFTLIKAYKEKEEDATAKVLQILRDSPFIGGFKLEIVYADKSI